VLYPVLAAVVAAQAAAIPEDALTLAQGTPVGRREADRLRWPGRPPKPSRRTGREPPIWSMATCAYRGCTGDVPADVN